MSRHWKEIHKKYRASDWIDKPSIFAKSVVEYFPAKGKMLDLGTGQGQDALFFADKGYKVVGLDSSKEAIEHAKDSDKDRRAEFEVKDFSNGLDYEDETFDVVYSHLALHYFDGQKTRKLFDEIYRVLKSGGILVFLVNSTVDPEIKELQPIEKNYYKVGRIYKRYFDVESTKHFAKKFKVILLDNQGETYKDRAIGVTNLIRFVGRKV